MTKALWNVVILVAVSAAIAQAQPLPIRMGYSILGSAISPVWMAKELGLFERHGVYSGPIYMAHTSTARYVNAHGEATRRVLRAVVEAIWAFKADREAALRAIKKYTRLTDRKLLEDSYESNRKVFRLTPRTTEGGVRNILDALADQNPRARGANPQDFYTNRFVDELEQTGFMRELAARYPAAPR